MYGVWGTEFSENVLVVAIFKIKDLRVRFVNSFFFLRLPICLYIPAVVPFHYKGYVGDVCGIARGGGGINGYTTLEDRRPPMMDCKRCSGRRF